MDYVVAVFTFGALLLLVGLIGGDLQFGGARVPKVGRLPRFTTTILGSAVLLLSLVLYGIAGSTGGNTSEPRVTPAPMLTPAESSPPPSPTSRSPSRPTPPGQDTVLVQFGAALEEPIYALEVQLLIDGAQHGGLNVDQATRERVIGVQLLPGEHDYELSVAWIDTQGFEYLDTGSGTITASEGAGYGVRVDGAGTAWLVVP